MINLKKTYEKITNLSNSTQKLPKKVLLEFFIFYCVHVWSKLLQVDEKF